MLYSKVVPNGDVTSMVPVEVVHVGSVMVARGAAGAPGTPLMVNVAEDMHVGFVVVRTRIVWVEFAANPLKVTEVCHVVPSLLYSIPEPVGEVMVIDPVTSAHVGSVIDATGAEGGRGIPFITKFAVETHVGWAVVRALIV